MSFLAGWRLLLLVGPMALVVGYLLAERSRRKAAVRFTSVDLLASVAPRRPGWQRHVPAIALLGALVVLVLGFARPTWDVRTPKQRATVVLTLDTSASMTADDVAPTRLAAAQAQAQTFAQALPAGLQLGLVAFDQNAQMLVAPTADRSTVLAAIHHLQVGGGTATGDAISLALNAITALPPGADGKPAPAAIVLMSDGAPTIGRGDQSPMQAVDAAAVSAKQVGVGISTIAFGTQNGSVTVQGHVVGVPSDPATMSRIAAESGGQSFTAETAKQLKSVYDQIGRSVGYDVHRTEITAWFTGIGLALAMLAAIAALLWSPRLV
jgi:Ca-activated chloride channel homolog